MNLVHIGISVLNLENAIKWYKKLFDFEETKRFEKKELEIKGAVITKNEITIEILEPYTIIKKEIPKLSLSEILRFQGLHHLAIAVDDVGAFYKKLKDNNAVLLTELIDNKFFFCSDLDGTIMEIRQK